MASCGLTRRVYSARERGCNRRRGSASTSHLDPPTIDSELRDRLRLREGEIEQLRRDLAAAGQPIGKGPG